MLICTESRNVMHAWCLCNVDVMSCAFSGKGRSFMHGEVDGWTAPTHPVFVREQRQRQTTCSMWFTITSVVAGGTDWTTGQHQSAGLQWTRSTDTAGHTWTGQWRLQSSSCSVWIHNGQDQQEQRLHLFNWRSAKTQTCIPVGRKSRWDRPLSSRRGWYGHRASEFHVGFWRYRPTSFQ